MQGGPGHAAPPPPPAPAPAKTNESTFTTLCHVSALAVFIGIPFGNVLGPLVVWLIKKDESAWVDAHGRASLNFQVSWTLYAAVAFLAVFVFQFVFFMAGMAGGMAGGPRGMFFPTAGGFVVMGLFMLVLLAAVVVWLVQVIMASLQAGKNQPVRYWLAIPFFGRPAWPSA